MNSPDVRRARVSDAWSRIEAWLGEHAAGTLATLNPPAGPAAVAEAERTLGFSLPADLVASLARHNGAGEDQATPGRFALAGGYGLMSLALILRDWRATTDILASLGEEMMAGHWWHPRWIPVADTVTPDRLIIDQRPGAEQGQAGKFLNESGGHFGRWDSFASVLAHTADLLEGRATDDWAVPRTASGRLVWGWSRRRDPNPRSVLTLAREARGNAGGTRGGAGATGISGPRSPSGPRLPAPRAPSGPAAPAGRPPPGRRRVTVAHHLTRPQPPAPEPGHGPAWILDCGRCCLTFACGLTEAEFIRRMGGDPAEDPADRTAGQVAASYEASWHSGYRPVVQAGRAGPEGEARDWVFGFELRHEEGIRDEVLCRLSAGTRAVSVAYSGLNTQLAYAEDGVVAGRFDSRWPERADGPGELRARMEQAGLLPADRGRYLEDDAVAAVSLAVGLGPGTFDPRVLRGPLRAAALLPLLSDPPTEPRHWPVQADPELVAAIEYATEEQLRPAAVALARYQVDDTGLNAHPEIVAGVAGAADRVAGQVPDDSPLGLVLRTLHAEANAGYAAFRDPAAQKLITEPERLAWGRRANVASGIEALLARPAVIAVYLLAGSPSNFGQRQALLDDLAGVTIPADATEQLEKAERERYESLPRVPWPGPRPSRRVPVPEARNGDISARRAGPGGRPPGTPRCAPRPAAVLRRHTGRSPGTRPGSLGRQRAPRRNPRW